jgi:epoxide hydrolase
MSVEPFEAHVPQRLLDDLGERLWRTRWPDRPPGASGETGIALGDIRDLVEYWRDGLDWRAAEARLSRLSQFRAGDRLSRRLRPMG